ncbi:MAG: hypothetical protein WC712_10975, partial [Candidatus Brocadiia bacterium]
LFPASAAFDGKLVVWGRRWVNVLDCRTGKFQFPACTGPASYAYFAMAQGVSQCCWLDLRNAVIWDYAADRTFSIPLPPDLQAERVWYNPALPGFVVEFEQAAVAPMSMRLVDGGQPFVFRGSVGSGYWPEGLVEPNSCSISFPWPPTSWPGTNDLMPFRRVYFAGEVFRLEDGVVVRYAAGGAKDAFATPAPVEHYAPVTETVILADKNLVNLAGRVLPVGKCYAMPQALIYTDPVHNKWVRLGKDGSFAQITMCEDAYFTADLAGTGNCVIFCWGMDDLLLCKWQPREPDATDRQIAGFLGWGE